MDLSLFIVITCVSINNFTNAWNKSQAIEDDIILMRFEQKSAVLHDSALWPRGIVPYIMDTRFTNKEKTIIFSSMKHISSQSCITFKTKDKEKDYIKFIKTLRPVCSSLVGKWRNEQPIRLGTKCFILPLIVHEILHALGFFHHHNRSDRDCYLTINFHNIEHKYHLQFTKILPYAQRIFTPFDFDSIMLYGSHLLSMNGEPTMISKITNKKLINPHEKGQMSPLDVLALNLLYNCRLTESMTNLLKSFRNQKFPSKC